MFLIGAIIAILSLQVKCETVLRTEVFAISIEPIMFNWTYEGIPDQFSYVASVKDKPDLPDWIHYKYSPKHRIGFLYGVPKSYNSDVDIQIVALNRLNYETRIAHIPIYVTEKLNSVRNEVQIKINNLNIEDMFDVYRMERLKDIFRKKLWKQSAEDLYVTFLESAIRMGARLPLRPNEGEGVFIRFGSTADLSENLIELQEEVKPLWKLHSCPRDFKRTTVERIFREAGFALDWCLFRLLENERNVKEEQKQSVIDKGDSINDKDELVSRSERVRRERDYVNELLVMIMVPIFIMTLFATVLTLILCVYHDQIFQKYQDRVSTEDTTEQYSSGAKPGVHTSLQLRQPITLPQDVVFNDYSPSGSLARTYNQPSPPPYPSTSKFVS